MQSIEKANGAAATESFKALASLVIVNPEIFQIDSGFYYPPTKCVDMYLWKVGYEMNLVRLLIDGKKSDDVKAKAYSKAVELRYCGDGLSPEEANREIKLLNLETL